MLSFGAFPTRPFGIALILALWGPTALFAQHDTTTVVAGRRYRAGAFKEFFLGRHYRDLWAAPLRVEVLDPTTFAGGLTPLRRGGGGSTKSLRLQGKDGRRYVFRTVDKYAMQTLGPELEGTLAASIVQDQVSAKHPAAALMVPPLMEAAGVLHVTPQLFVMPDHPFLGEFRAEFAGLLGTLEERPEDGEEEVQAGFAGAARVISTERLLRYLDTDPQHRVDSRAYLTARLMDVFIGDWDRHADQWRWARFEGAEGTHLWRAIPRDRDNAFVDHDGLILDLARASLPRLVEFDAKYADIYGLTVHAAPLDRRLLSDLPREVWDSVATALQARITNEVIDAGIARLPAEYRERNGAEMAAKLRARRDRLPEAASRLYAQLSSEVDVHATSQPERAEIERLPEGRVAVRLYGNGNHAGSRSNQPYFQRTFRREETKEVRLYLGGGDDHAILRGEAERSIGVRVIGAEGNDVLVDSSRVRNGSGRAVFYDDRGENVIVRGPGTRVDRRAYTAPSDSAAPPGAEAYQDWGSRRFAFVPSAEWRSNIGPVVGGGPVFIRYGFRREPYARRMALRALVAPTLGRFGVEYAGDFRRTNSGVSLELLARASDIEVTRFHGLGNQTPREGNDGRYKIEEREFDLEPVLHAPVGRGFGIFAGPIFRYTDPRVPTDAPAAQLDFHGNEPFGQVGVQAGAVLDRRDSQMLPRRGVLLQVGGTGFPAVWNDADPFVKASLLGSTYLSLPAPLAPTLALRAGGLRSWGDFPLQEAAFIGGSGTLRGYPDQRFAGEAALFGGSELRVRLAPVQLILPGDLGAFGLADAARVYVDGESPGGWHTGYGGGLWLSLLEGRQVFTASYAYGEEPRLYLRMGFSF